MSSIEREMRSILTSAEFEYRSSDLRLSFGAYRVEIVSKVERRDFSSRICMKLLEAESGLFRSKPVREIVRRRF
jgi:hypothetical protein